jgi:hypothetical protein
VGDTTAALNSCGLKCRRVGPSFNCKEEKRREETEARVYGSKSMRRKESLEDLELYVYVLRHAVVHCLDCRETSEDKFGVFFRGATHEDGVKEVLLDGIASEEIILKPST